MAAIGTSGPRRQGNQRQINKHIPNKLKTEAKYSLCYLTQYHQDLTVHNYAQNIFN